jgi:hypothetical protein
VINTFFFFIMVMSNLSGKELPTFSVGDLGILITTYRYPVSIYRYEIT